MPLSSNDQAKAKKTAAVFVALTVIIVAAMVAAMVIIPYDPGTLAPATLSSNLCYGGNVTETDDYVFFRQRNGNLARLSRENGEIKTVFEGDVSCLNPLDGFKMCIRDRAITQLYSDTLSLEDIFLKMINEPPESLLKAFDKGDRKAKAAAADDDAADGTQSGTDNADDKSADDNADDKSADEKEGDR